MKSVGEAMSIGRTFEEALPKAARSSDRRDGLVSLLGRVDYRALAATSPGRCARSLGVGVPRPLHASPNPRPRHACRRPDEELREAVLDVIGTARRPAPGTWSTRSASARPSTRSSRRTGIDPGSSRSSSDRRREKRHSTSGQRSRAVKPLAHKALGFSDAPCIAALHRLDRTAVRGPQRSDVEPVARASTPAPPSSSPHAIPHSTYVAATAPAWPSKAAEPARRS